MIAIKTIYSIACIKLPVVGAQWKLKWLHAVVDLYLAHNSPGKSDHISHYRVLSISTTSFSIYSIKFPSTVDIPNSIVNQANQSYNEVTFKTPSTSANKLCVSWVISLSLMKRRNEMSRWENATSRKCVIVYRFTKHPKGQCWLVCIEHRSQQKLCNLSFSCSFPRQVVFRQKEVFAQANRILMPPFNLIMPWWWPGKEFIQLALFGDMLCHYIATCF